MNKRLLLCFLVTCLTSPVAISAAITNGNFASCDFAGWQKDTDGLGDISTVNDFQITGTSPQCSAELLVDGANTEAFFANTLYQRLDFIDSQPMMLSFDLELASRLTSSDQGFVGDYAVVAISDGTGNYFDAQGNSGFLFSGIIDGMESLALSYTLADVFDSASDWFLEFQLNIGADAEGLSDGGVSSMRIDNVTLASVPAPATYGLFLLAATALVQRKRRMSVLVLLNGRSV
ncbi:hypothetical protein CA267_011260 [Alteromonas pelagimontana]|uniref:PEP-CTERM sorting domain-containing protein n=1 Tax=Alteromonas pelagimontana TaxID=1858656 RepID=A0A6M4MDP7_9ALTE|nr:hypothetical protein [Alteromonas pelagimontana]QJR81314.1 hypothetical protein CA267_011260 [Alteromonas pelagimontana]